MMSAEVEGPDSEMEKKGGEYFYSQHCSSHIHADINAARNMIQVQPDASSAVPGQANKEYPSLPN
jgi:transposase